MVAVERHHLSPAERPAVRSQAICRAAADQPLSDVNSQLRVGWYLCRSVFLLAVVT